MENEGRSGAYPLDTRGNWRPYTRKSGGNLGAGGSPGFENVQELSSILGEGEGTLGEQKEAGYWVAGPDGVLVNDRALWESVRVELWKVTQLALSAARQAEKDMMAVHIARLQDPVPVSELLHGVKSSEPDEGVERPNCEVASYISPQRYISGTTAHRLLPKTK